MKKIIILTVFLAFCKTPPQKGNKNPKRSKEIDARENIKKPFVPPVTPQDLKVLNARVSDNPNDAKPIEVKALTSENTQFIEAKLCSKNNPTKCTATKSSANQNIAFNKVPEDKQNIVKAHVRSCVTQETSLDPKTNCGDWQKSENEFNSSLHEKTPVDEKRPDQESYIVDKELGKKTDAIEEEEKKITDSCGKIIDASHKLIKETSDPNLRRTAENITLTNPDLCKEYVKQIDLKDAPEEKVTSEKTKKTEEVKTATANTTQNQKKVEDNNIGLMLGLGTSAVITLVAAGLSFTYIYKAYKIKKSINDEKESLDRIKTGLKTRLEKTKNSITTLEKSITAIQKKIESDTATLTTKKRDLIKGQEEYLQLNEKLNRLQESHDRFSSHLESQKRILLEIEQRTKALAAEGEYIENRLRTSNDAITKTQRIPGLYQTVAAARSLKIQLDKKVLFNFKVEKATQKMWEFISYTRPPHLLKKTVTDPRALGALRKTDEKFVKTIYSEDYRSFKGLRAEEKIKLFEKAIKQHRNNPQSPVKQMLDYHREVAGNWSPIALMSSWESYGFETTDLSKKALFDSVFDEVRKKSLILELTSNSRELLNVADATQSRLRQITKKYKELGKELGVDVENIEQSIDRGSSLDELTKRHRQYIVEQREQIRRLHDDDRRIAKDRQELLAKKAKLESELAKKRTGFDSQTKNIGEISEESKNKNEEAQRIKSEVESVNESLKTKQLELKNLREQLKNKQEGQAATKKGAHELNIKKFEEHFKTSKRNALASFSTMIGMAAFTAFLSVNLDDSQSLSENPDATFKKRILEEIKEIRAAKIRINILKQ